MKLLSLLLLFPQWAYATDSASRLDLTNTWVGLTALLMFAGAYLLVMSEEFIQLRKSKPVMLAAGIIWGAIAWYYQAQGLPHVVENALRHSLEEYAELMLFLLVAMTFINVLDERNVFAALRAWLLHKRLSYRDLFWVLGLMTFLISPLADNITTALLMASVAMAVGINSKKFVALSCINIVIASNAGGAFSPFGDITTLMIWQKNIHASNGYFDFWSFFNLILPALVSWLVPTIIMHFAIPKDTPADITDPAQMKRGAKTIIGLFLFTILLAIGFHSILQLPPVIGMLSGLSLLQFYAYYLKRIGEKSYVEHHDGHLHNNQANGYDIFRKVSRVEWDTLFFFYGVLMCISGLGFIGYLANWSQLLYVENNITQTNIAAGVLSAFVDNVPVMFAILEMMPNMSMGQWLLVTLTTGIGGSLLAVGSASGIALMTQARDSYTFWVHLKWLPVIALGYAASIATHFWINAHLF